MRTNNSAIYRRLPAAGPPSVGAPPCFINSVVFRILPVVFLLFLTLWPSPPEAAPATSWNFERSGWLEIDSLDIGPFSLKEYMRDQWQEFCLPRPFNLATINFLQSPWLFNKPFASWLNIVAALLLIGAAIFYFKAGDKKKIKIVSSIGFTMLVLWVIYDIRETYSQYQMVEEVYRSYVRPPPGEKTFPALGNFYRFIDLCREKIPPDSQYHFYPYPDWPYDCRIHYFLYPRRIRSATWNNVIEGKDIPYHVVYRNPRVAYDTPSRRLRRKGPYGESFISPPGRVVVLFDRYSFIFMEDR